MEEHIIKDKLYSYLFYVMAVVIFVASVLFHNLYGLVIVAFIVFVAAVYFKSGHIINNLLIKRSKLIEVYNGYSLMKDLSAAVKRVGNSYLGVSIAVLNITRELEGRTEQFKQVLESTKEPFEFCIGLIEIDRTRLLDSLQAKRRMKEIALTRIPQKSYDKANKVKREMEMIENEIRNVQGSGKSFEVSLKLKSTAISRDEAEAGREAAENLVKVANTFSTSFGLEYEILKGEDLLDAVEVYL